MAVYAISDLHLALSEDKPMDVFGGRWTDYMERLKNEWRAMVCEDDHVLVPGDISWATYLDEAYEDFRFVEELPGRKYISKGNHDYWWTTASKLDKFLKANNFKTISFLHNNSYNLNGTAICGTRGWTVPGSEGFSAEDRKIYEREIIRLELSLKSAKALENRSITTVLHFPPFGPKGQRTGFIDVMSSYGVKRCIYGHLHGENCRNAVEGFVNGIEFILVSADHLFFKPLRLE